MSGDAKITLVGVAGPVTDGSVQLDATIVADPDPTFDALGLLVWLAAHPGTHLIAAVARERFYDPACLTAVAADLVHNGYAEITDGGGA